MAEAVGSNWEAPFADYRHTDSVPTSGVWRISAMITFDPNAPMRMWLERYGRRPVNRFAALITVVGLLLGCVSVCFGTILLRILAVMLFFGGVRFLNGFRRRPIHRDDDEDLPGPQSLF